MSIMDTDALDQADMRRLVAGEATALDTLMDRHAGPIFQFLFRLTGEEDEANDLAQETFLRLYRARASFRLGHRFSTWLYTIAGNLARTHLRWRSRHPRVSLDAESPATGQTLADVLPSGSPSPLQDAESSELHRAVRAAVQELPEDLREALVLCEWEELSMAEAAAILGTTAKGIENRLCRARRLLRDRFAKVLASEQRACQPG